MRNKVRAALNKMLKPSTKDAGLLAIDELGVDALPDLVVFANAPKYTQAACTAIVYLGLRTDSDEVVQGAMLKVLEKGTPKAQAMMQVMIKMVNDEAKDATLDEGFGLGGAKLG